MCYEKEVDDTDRRKGVRCLVFQGSDDVVSFTSYFQVSLLLQTDQHDRARFTKNSTSKKFQAHRALAGKPSIDRPRRRYCLSLYVQGKGGNRNLFAIPRHRERARQARSESGSGHTGSRGWTEKNDEHDTLNTSVALLWKQ